MPSSLTLSITLRAISEVAVTTADGREWFASRKDIRKIHEDTACQAAQHKRSAEQIHNRVLTAISAPTCSSVMASLYPLSNLAWNWALWNVGNAMTDEYEKLESVDAERASRRAHRSG